MAELVYPSSVRIEIENRLMEENDNEYYTIDVIECNGRLIELTYEIGGYNPVHSRFVDMSRFKDLL